MLVVSSQTPKHRREVIHIAQRKGVYLVMLYQFSDPESIGDRLTADWTVSLGRR